VGEVSKRASSPGKLLRSAVRLVAIYAGVRAALRAEALHNDRADRIPRSVGGPKREVHERAGAGNVEPGTPKALGKAPTSAVRKVRAPVGDVQLSSDSSATDSSTSTRRHRAHEGTAGRTYRQLYEEARRRGVQGRSGMSKAALEKALSHAKTSASGRP
jgi:hypothetical protein